MRLTVSSVNDDLTRGISCGSLPALAENISMHDDNVNSDLLRDGCKPPSIFSQVIYIRNFQSKQNEHVRTFKNTF